MKKGHFTDVKNRIAEAIMQGKESIMVAVYMGSRYGLVDHLVTSLPKAQTTGTHSQQRAHAFDLAVKLTKADFPYLK